MFTSNEIHDIKFELMQRCTEIIVKDDVFKTLELHPKRIYDDSVLAIDSKLMVHGKSTSREKDDRIYKINLPHSAINHRPTMTDKQKQKLINNLLTVNTASKTINYRTIANLSGNSDEDIYSKMPKLKTTNVSQPYVYATMEANNESARMSQTRVIQ
jgi:hypothetical protein